MPASPLHDDMHSVLPDVADSMGSTAIDDSPLPIYRGCKICGHVQAKDRAYSMLFDLDFCDGCFTKVMENNPRTVGDMIDVVARLRVQLAFSKGVRPMGWSGEP